LQDHAIQGRRGQESKSKVKEEPAEDEDVDDAEATKPAPKKGRGKAKVKEEPAEDEQVDDVKPEKEAKATTDFKEAQVAKAGTSHIPLDEGCHLTSYHVYVDPNDQMIYDASLNQTNAGHNNNKFYRVQVSCVPLRLC
jgi:poly [ADP-ribose] polymerase